MKNKFDKLLPFAIVLLFAFNSYAQKDKLLTPINKPDNWEAWHDKVPVSGEIRVGLLYDFNELKVDNESFFIDLPENENTILCIQVNSIDGRYRGKLEFNIEGLEAGSYKIDWSSKYSKELKKYSSKELSILSVITNDCQENPSNYVVSSWEKSNSDTVYVLLNVDKRVYITIKDEQQNINEKIICDNLEEPVMVTYNCICKLPKNKITDQSEVIINQRVRKPGRISYKEYSLNILK